MKIGTFITIFDKKWRQTFLPFLDAGFDFFEVLPEDEASVSARDVKIFVKNHEVILHAPFIESNLIASDYLFRHASYIFFKQRLLPYTRLFNPKVITVHLGHTSFLFPKIELDSCLALKKIFPRLTIENMPAPANKWVQAYPWTADQLDRILSRTHSRVTFDVGHFFTQGYDVYRLVKRYMPYIENIHIHDVVSGKDHQPLGTGSLDLERFMIILRRNEYSGYVSIELASDNVRGAIDSLRVLRKYV